MGWRSGQSLAPSRAPPNAKPAQQEDSPYYASDPMPDYDNVFTDKGRNKDRADLFSTPTAEDFPSEAVALPD